MSEQSNERELFEAWYGAPRKLERSESGYKFMAAHTDWTTWKAARAPLLSRIAELEAINKLAVEFREASKITQARVNSEEFWATANEADIDEIELEETLARVRLFAAIDAAMRGNE